ncbi:hypothetical protein LCGC14_2541140, partial [marine sediment metagenome]
VSSVHAQQILDVERGSTVTFEWDAVTTLEGGSPATDSIFYQVYATPILNDTPQWGSSDEITLRPDRWFFSGDVEARIIIQLPLERYRIWATSYRYNSKGIKLESIKTSELIFFNMKEVSLPPATPVSFKVKIE